MLTWNTTLGKAIPLGKVLPVREDEGATAKPSQKSLLLSNSRAFICPPPTQTRIPVHSMKTKMLPSSAAQTKTQQEG